LTGILPENQNFQGGERLILFQIGLFVFVEVTRVFLETKPSVLETGESSTLLSSENCVSFGKEYVLQPWFFKVEIGSFCSI
jgi:hypothetical protein